jgi:oligoribonuclease
MPLDRRLAWVDLETSGFTELRKKAVYDHKILEIGIIVTDYDLNPVAKLNLVVNHNLSDVLPLCDDVVLKMHQDNGLFDDVQKSALTQEQAEEAAIAFLIEHGVGRKHSPLCGNGIHFDREFIEVHLPKLDDHLHYRNLDISAIKEFINTIAPGLEPKKKRAHRAMDDIVESLAEARHYRGIIAPALQAAKKALTQNPDPEP